MHRAAPFVLLFFSSACTSAPAPSTTATATEEDPVVGGRVETGFPAIGYLAIGKDEASLKGPNCGATLVGAKLAVTAGHCILTQGPAFGIGFGAPQSGPVYPAKAVYVHPDYDPNAAPRYRHDVAFLVFAEAPPVEHMTVATAQPVNGSTVRYVGYGRTTTGDVKVKTGYDGTRKSTAMSVSYRDAFDIFASGEDGGLCWGDSGGPIVKANGLVAGVLADFDGVFDCEEGNAMVFTSLVSEWDFVERARACAAGDPCELVPRAVAPPPP